ncbi:MAG: type II secretion system F family protein [Acidimicrobiia bacterium]|nr:type II secretion system F family protein [Acidimicrobiia bacterium]
MPLRVYLACAAIAGAVPMLWWAVSGSRAARAVRANLVPSQGPVTDLRQVVLERSARERVVSPLVGGLATRARRLTPAGVVDALERRILLAGVSGTWPIERVLAAKLVLGLAGALVGLARLAVAPSAASLFLGAVAAGGGYLVPDVLLSRRASERQERIERELPDTLDQVTIGVEAGLGFEAALARAARSGHGPVAEELTRTLQDIQIGVPRTRALEAMTERTDVRDLRTFVHAVSQAERHGIPIAHVLRIQAAELREKRKQRAEERAVKVPVKLVFPVVCCILPALFVVLAGPAVVRLSQTGIGGG